MARKSCPLLFCKVYLILFNLVFMLCGFGILGVGLWSHLDKEACVYLYIIQGLNSAPFLDKIPFVLIGVGAVISVLSFMGCCGACAESPCFLCLYSIVLLLLILTQLVCVGLGFIYQDTVNIELAKNMHYQIKFVYNRTSVPDVNRTDMITIAWDAMQVELKCCGAMNPHDYEFSNWWNHTRPQQGLEVPHTCCVLLKNDPEWPIVKDNDHCQIEAILYPKWMREHRQSGREIDFTELYTTGCYEALCVHMSSYSWTMGVVSLVILIFEIVGFAIACALIVQLRKEEKEGFEEEE